MMKSRLPAVCKLPAFYLLLAQAETGIYLFNSLFKKAEKFLEGIDSDPEKRYLNQAFKKTGL